MICTELEINIWQKIIVINTLFTQFAKANDLYFSSSTFFRVPKLCKNKTKHKNVHGKMLTYQNNKGYRS